MGKARPADRSAAGSCGELGGQVPNTAIALVLTILTTVLAGIVAAWKPGETAAAHQTAAVAYTGLVSRLDTLRDREIGASTGPVAADAAEEIWDEITKVQGAGQEILKNAPPAPDDLT